MQDTIEREILISAPIERVWEIVTTPEHMGQWFGDAGASRSGNVITMAWEKYGEADLEVVREDAPQHLRLLLGRERQGGRADARRVLPHPGGLGHPRAGGRERVRRAEGHDEVRAELREGNVGGWEHELGDLERYAQTVTV